MKPQSHLLKPQINYIPAGARWSTGLFKSPPGSPTESQFVGNLTFIRKGSNPSRSERTLLSQEGPHLMDIWSRSVPGLYA